MLPWKRTKAGTQNGGLEAKPRRERKHHINGLLFATLILAIVGIVAVAFFSCNFAYVLALKVGSTCENASVSVLLSTGLSIIGIAISVWAALNITNAINRGDIENLRDTVSDLKSTTKIIEPYINHNKNIQFELFLVELERFSEDPIIDYFANLFRQYYDYSEALPYSELIVIELKFSQVRKRHQSAYHYDPVLISTAKEGLKAINNVNEKLGVGLYYIKKYLEYRKYEFMFFMGYCESGKKEGADLFYKAVEGYLRYAESFGANFQQQTDQATRYRTAYLSNTIGESYSKIVHYYIEEREQLSKFAPEIRKIADNAVKYCELSIQLLSIEQQTSTYYRNLGCAYERRDGLTKDFRNCHKAIDAYKKAFLLLVDDPSASRSNIIKAYYTLLSYYGRIISQKITNRNEWDLENIETEYQRSNSLSEQIVCYICDMYHIAKIAMDDCANSMIIANLYCEVCCFILLAMKMGIDFTNKLSVQPHSYYINEINIVLDRCAIMERENKENNICTLKPKTIRAVVKYLESSETEVHNGEDLSE